MVEHPKVTVLMRKRSDRHGNVFYVGRPKLPVSLQLDRFVVLMFPFTGDRDREDGAELVFELAHEDATFKNAGKLVRRVADKIKDPDTKRTVIAFLDSIVDEKPNSKDRDDDKSVALEEANAKIAELESELAILKRDEMMSEHFPGDKKGGKG